MADFFDIFSIGEGEEALPELLTLYYECRENGLSKREFLRRAAGLEGFYVPSLYDVTYNADGTLASFAPSVADPPGGRGNERPTKDKNALFCQKKKSAH